MNSDIAQGEWKQLSGKIKQKWGKLTDDDLTRAQGDRDYLVGKLHEQYGIARDQVEGDLDTLSYREGEQGGDLDREDPSGRSGSNFGTGSTSNRGNPSQKAGGSSLNDPRGDAGSDVEDEYGNANMSLQQDGGGAGHTLEAGSGQDKSGQKSGQPGQGSSSSKQSQGSSKDAQKSGQQGRGGSGSDR